MNLATPEPDWAEVEGRILSLKARQIGAIASAWFCGCLGGASTKRDRAHEMATQMRHWWHEDTYYGLAPRQRVANVLEMIAAEEARS